MKKMICVASGNWSITKKNFWGKEKTTKNLSGPKYGEIVTVDEEGDDYYSFVNHLGTYIKICFVDISEDEERAIIKAKKYKALEDINALVFMPNRTPNAQVSDTTTADSSNDAG